MGWNEKCQKTKKKKTKKKGSLQQTAGERDDDRDDRETKQTKWRGGFVHVGLSIHSHIQHIFAQLKKGSNEVKTIRAMDVHWSRERCDREESRLLNRGCVRVRGVEARAPLPPRTRRRRVPPSCPRVPCRPRHPPRPLPPRLPRPTPRP